jgi:flagellar hook-associated protein 3 FlgL
MRTAENQMSVLTDRSATLEQIISQVEELDYISAVTELKNQTLALQAGQSSFAQISNLSLFNYIK